MTRGTSVTVGYLALGLIAVGVGVPHQAAAEELDGAPVGEAFVKMACAAEVGGQNGIRKALVDRLLVEDPANEKVHWLAGHVRDGDAWKDAREFERCRADDPLLKEYAERRETSGEDVASRLKLANWCRDHDMPDREKVHLMELVSWHGVVDPAVMSRLGMVKYRGGWVPKTEVEQLLRLDEEQGRIERKWKPLFASWKADLKSGETTAYERLNERLAGVSDTDALPILEEVISVTDEKAALAVVAWLDRMSSQEATESLVRHAIFSEFDTVRMAAAEALKKRPKYNYIPLLLDELVAPTEVTVELPFGNAVYVRRTTVERGKEHDLKMVDHELTSLSTYYLRRRRLEIRSLHKGLVVPGLYVERGTEKTQRNDKVMDTLYLLTGEDYRDVEHWKDWWRDYAEYESQDEKPVYEGHHYVSCHFTKLVPSCLAWGTPVVTETGSRSVEQILPGDRVLSQDVDTGQLEYKVVLHRTVRRLGEMRKVSVGDDSVTVTLGHPFWVVGKGWRMAKELEVGERVCCLGDSAKVTAIEELPEDVAYNLVVDDFGTYFAGTSRVLLHDNTMPQPTDTVLPGYVP